MKKKPFITFTGIEFLGHAKVAVGLLEMLWHQGKLEGHHGKHFFQSRGTKAT